MVRKIYKQSHPQEAGIHVGDIEEQTKKIITNNDVLGGNKRGLKSKHTIRGGRKPQKASPKWHLN